MKKILEQLYKLMPMLAVLIVVGTGYAPQNAANAAQARYMARRAAIVDCFVQTNGAPMRIMKEAYSGGKYTVTAEVQ